MPFAALIAAFILSSTAAEEPPITVRAYPWAPFISPMGEPFRGRATAESPIARWFVQADLNGDGALTADEGPAQCRERWKPTTRHEIVVAASFRI